MKKRLAISVLCMSAAINLVGCRSDSSDSSDNSSAVKEVSSEPNTAEDMMGSVFTDSGETDDDLNEPAKENNHLPKGAKSAKYEGHTYEVFEDSMTWLEAEEICKKMNGHLASINSADEQSFIMSLISDSEKENFWIGGLCLANGSWVWNDGSAWSYENWEENVPDGINGNEFYLRIKNGDQKYTQWTAHDGKWNDTANAGDDEVPLSTYGFICEYISGSVEQPSTLPKKADQSQRTTEPVQPATEVTTQHHDTPQTTSPKKTQQPTEAPTQYSEPPQTTTKAVPQPTEAATEYYEPPRPTAQTQPATVYYEDPVEWAAPTLEPTEPPSSWDDPQDPYGYNYGW